jgi:uncharacterized protein YbjT (DUF2867 family)
MTAAAPAGNAGTAGAVNLCLQNDRTEASRPMSVLLTGAAGTIGTALARELRAAGVPFATMTSRAGATIDGAETRHGDFRDRESLRRAFAGIDTLFLLLPLVPDKLERADNALAAAKAPKCRRTCWRCSAARRCASRSSRASTRRPGADHRP